jgi:hypothetical protein
VLTVKRTDFQRVMNESPITAEAVGKIVQQRLEAHRAADSRSGRGLFSFLKRRP